MAGYRGIPIVASLEFCEHFTVKTENSQVGIWDNFELKFYSMRTFVLFTELQAGIDHFIGVPFMGIVCIGI